ncbi:carboxylesterase/lipase family protein [Rhodopila sp.]|uniref:carboxylesterase/lipase family protein n=1 Tax=Rhodopila sp. TaxID=2480087 RepID=UPI003D1043C0
MTAMPLDDTANWANNDPIRWTRTGVIGMLIGRRPIVAAAAVSGLMFDARSGRAIDVEPPCGPVRGLAAEGVTAFLGLPYAAAPTGARRYNSPRPARRWTAPRDATRAGAASIQTLGGAAAWLYESATPQSEDCLFLNVWTPGVTGRRPVMVWIHGGAWRTGRGNAVGTNGTALAKTGDVVVVTINYRLGALGWLAHPALADSETGAFANWGLQDQVAALRWVQANIAAFGGDPANVTLFGQSAGGSSTASIAQDSRNAGLLHKAIIESGSLHGAPGFPEIATAAAYAEALAKRLDVTVPELRHVPAMTLHQAELTLARDPVMVRSLGRPPVLPVLDGVVLKVWPRDGALPAIPLLIGTTRTEGTFWYDLIGPDGKQVPGLAPPADRARLVSMIHDLVAIYRPEGANIPPEHIADAYAAAARQRGTSDTPLPLWIAAYTDIVFRLRARAAAERHVAAGHPTFLYEFARPLVPPAHGVPHTAEIPFVFGTYADPFFAKKAGDGADSATLSAFMLGTWAAFAHRGVPDKNWTPAADPMPSVNILGGSDGLHAVDHNLRTEELAAWNMR